MKLPRILQTLAALMALPCAAVAQTSETADRPNILVIWGDDIGMWNISAYHRGMMGGSTLTSTVSPMTACCSWITTRRHPARLVGRHS